MITTKETTMKLALVLVCLAVPALANAKPKPPGGAEAPKGGIGGAAADKKPDSKVPIEVAQSVDYKMIRMGYIGQNIAAEKTKEANDEIAKQEAPLRSAVRAFEKEFGIKLFDDKWNRCCDSFNPETGEVWKGGYDAWQKAQQQQPQSRR